MVLHRPELHFERKRSLTNRGQWHQVSPTWNLPELQNPICFEHIWLTLFTSIIMLQMVAINNLQFENNLFCRIDVVCFVMGWLLKEIMKMNICIFYIEYRITCRIYIYNITKETSVMKKYIASTRKYSFYEISLYFVTPNTRL